MYSFYIVIILAASRENLSSGFLTRSDTNRSVQPQKTIYVAKTKAKTKALFLHMYKSDFLMTWLIQINSLPCEVGSKYISGKGARGSRWGCIPRSCLTRSPALGVVRKNNRHVPFPNLAKHCWISRGYIWNL